MDEFIPTPKGKSINVLGGCQGSKVKISERNRRMVLQGINNHTSSPILSIRRLIIQALFAPPLESAQASRGRTTAPRTRPDHCLERFTLQPTPPPGTTPGMYKPQVPCCCPFTERVNLGPANTEMKSLSVKAVGTSSATRGVGSGNEEERRGAGLITGTWGSFSNL